MDSNSDIDEVMRVFHSILSASEEGDVDGYLDVITDDAVMMYHGMPAMIGKEAVGPFLTDFFSSYKFQLTDYTFEEKRVMGDWALLRYNGVAVISLKDGGESTLRDRKYFEILRKQDGRWKFSHHIYNLNK